MKSLKILISSGGTREAIDSVRYIGNFSTGQTGAMLADSLAIDGHQVTLLQGIGSVSPDQQNVERHFFSDISNLQKQLEHLIKNRGFDLVIMAAAVADFTVAQIIVDDKVYSPEQLNHQKISSSGEITLKLKSTPKLIGQMELWCKQVRQNKPTLVAFKLTRNLTGEEQQKAVKKLFQHPDVDFVIHNDLFLINRDSHPAQLYERGQQIAVCNTKHELPNLIRTIIERKKLL